MVLENPMDPNRTMMKLTARKRPVTRKEALDALEALLPNVPKCMYVQRSERHTGRPCSRCAAVCLLARTKRGVVSQ
jgi:hypothetical protein